MRTRIRPVVLFGLLLGVVACRGGAEDAGAGTWVMHLDGAPFMVLTLERSDDRLDGTFSHPARMSTDGLTFSGISGEVVTTRVRGMIRGEAEVTLVAEDSDDRDGGTPMELTIVSPDEASQRVVDCGRDAGPLPPGDRTAAGLRDAVQLGRTPGSVRSGARARCDPARSRRAGRRGPAGADADAAGAEAAARGRAAGAGVICPHESLASCEDSTPRRPGAGGCRRC